MLSNGAIFLAIISIDNQLLIYIRERRLPSSYKHRNLFYIIILVCHNILKIEEIFRESNPIVDINHFLWLPNDWKITPELARLQLKSPLRQTIYIGNVTIL